MTTRLPSLFISHGSPMLAISDSPARQFLLELGQSLPRPQAIVVVSAHWETLNAPAVSLAPRPETIHDFGGFPAELFALRYPAPGAPTLAERAAQLLERSGFKAQRSPDRGLDHGAWVPLRLLYPKADIPVVQVSLIHRASPAEHLKLGQALGALGDAGVMIIGSGSLTHNLSEFRGQGLNATVPDWVSAFSTWMHNALEANQQDALLDYRRQAPHAVRNHPTEEHLLPLFVAMGAVGAQAQARRLHSSFEYGVLAMDVYGFQ